MSVLERLNAMDAPAAEAALRSICGSPAWARSVAARRPFADPDELGVAAESGWDRLEEDDWLDAVDAHPRIGESASRSGAAASAFSESEQSLAAASVGSTRQRLLDAQRAYEKRFGFGYLVCAAGRTSAEILADCRARTGNDRAEEIRRAAEEERKIGRVRLSRWLEQGGPS